MTARTAAMIRRIFVNIGDEIHEAFESSQDSNSLELQELRKINQQLHNMALDMGYWTDKPRPAGREGTS